MPFQPLNTSNSLESNFSQVNGLMTDFKNQQQVNIFKDDTGTPVVILNKDGLRTTSPGGGINVTTATNSQFTFNSQQNVFKIVSSGTNSIVATSATAGTSIIKTIPHSLGYVPAFLAYFSNGGSYYQLPNSTGWGSSGGVMTFTNWLFASTDSTNLYLTLIPSSSGNIGTFPIKWYLLQESAS